MRINLRCGDILVAEQILHGPDVRPVFQQMRGERMAQHMRAHALIQSRPQGGFLDDLLKRGVQDMMPSSFPRARIAQELPRRKEPLPFPGFARIPPELKPRASAVPTWSG